MGTVRSKDGTRIAFDRQGSGAVVIFVGGGLDDGSENAPLAAELAKEFTVYNFARRGRGESGDTRPYALERELEDLEALIAESGGRAHLYGASTGGALVLEAAAAGARADRIAVYEVPYSLAGDWPARWRDYVHRLDSTLASDHRDDAVDLFLRVTGSSDDDIAGLHESPYWAPLSALAHTLAYDAACLGDGRPPTSRLAKIAQPTLIMTGDDRPSNAAAWVLALDEAADALAASIPNARRQIIRGQGHVPSPEVLGLALVSFFGDVKVPKP